MGLPPAVGKRRRRALAALSRVVLEAEVPANLPGGLQVSQVQRLAIQGDGVAVGVAAEAVEAAAAGIEAHGRRALGMKKAAGISPAAGSTDA
jgi:hypothetical protein